MDTKNFNDFALNKSLLRALSEQGYQKPTEIQQAAIGVLLKGKDLFASAQTGTGKTAAFSLPILQVLDERRVNRPKDKPIRALILTPTRELALQIDESFRAYGRHLPLRTAVVLGGVSASAQIKALRKRPEILVATPGRLLDLMGQGHIRLNDVEMLVLDEADRMLDMGFIHDVRKIVGKVATDRQTMLFSATLPEAVIRLASSMLKDPARISVAPKITVAENITQKILFVQQMHKNALLKDMLREKSVAKALVFTRTKRRANRLSEQLSKDGISADSIHSNKSQNARQRALADFDRGRVKVLVATDIVARGIDVDGITHVINYELPNEAESYVHRIGRTARAGADGVALSFCDTDELALLGSIEKLTRNSLPAMEDHRFHSSSIALLRGLYSGSAKKRTTACNHRRPGARRSSRRRVAAWQR
ncbi:MAG: DEAD/DEAH box helicase [Planctomycetota bacterium]|jgi:ATP-dependent RNA helicase RhlE